METGRSSGRFEDLKKQIARRKSMLVAYSGGVDSALLAAVATELLGSRARCVFLDSPLVPRSAVRDAERIARDLRLSFEIVRKDGLDETMRRNPPDRCYHCKLGDAKILKERARELRLSCVADGVNLSDTGEYRPGILASTGEGIVHPFIEAGITKEEIRRIAREKGYEFWDKPSDACLSSRIPYGEEITETGLRTIESLEDFLHTLGFRHVRVRMHSGTARIEVGGEEIERIAAMRGEIVEKFKNAGIPYVTLDLEGYRSGSMDEVLGE